MSARPALSTVVSRLRSPAVDSPSADLVADDTASTYARFDGADWAGGVGSASLSTTCALVPVIPNALTPASAGRDPVAGQAVARATTRTGSRCQANCGVGSVKWSCGGISLCRKASTVLI